MSAYRRNVRDSALDRAEADTFYCAGVLFEWAGCWSLLFSVETVVLIVVCALRLLDVG